MLQNIFCPMNIFLFDFNLRRAGDNPAVVGYALYKYGIGGCGIVGGEKFKVGFTVIAESYARVPVDGASEVRAIGAVGDFIFR